MTLINMLKHGFRDIRFWIVFAFIIRLWGIQYPPLETLHNWRQVTGNMVSRNFLEIDNNILYPRLDFAGEKTGITGTEFPAFNYLMYITAKIFGWNHWYGRLINLIVTSLGIWYFFKMIKRLFSEPHAYYSSFILIFSIWFMYTRKSMPDTFSVSLVIIGLYFGVKYLFENRIFNAILFSLFITIGVLSKLPAILLLTFLIFPFFNTSISIKKKIILTLFLIPLIIPAWWYFIHVPMLVTNFGFWHYYMGTDFSNGLIEIQKNIQGTLEMFYYTPLMFSGFAIFITGLLVAIFNKHKISIIFLIISFLLFFVFMLKAGRNFYIHGYYIIPFVPIMAIMAANAFELRIIKKYSFFVLLLFFSEGIANQQHDFRIKPQEYRRLKLETISDSISKSSDLIIFNGGDNPRDIYYSHRKGWTVNCKRTLDSLFVDSLMIKGASFLFLDLNYFENEGPKTYYPIVYKDSDYIVMKLTAK